MKIKSLLFLFALLSLLLSSGCKTTSGAIKKDKVTTDGLCKIYNKVEGFTDKIEFIGTNRNGVREGVWSQFDTDGKRYASITYLNGKREGNTILWHTNGFTNSIVFYKQGLRSGEVIQFYETREILRRGQYDTLGERDGLWLDYHLNGKVAKESLYKNGKASGLEKTYDAEGLLVSSGNLTEGRKNGLWQFYRSGKPSAEGNYLNGKEEGVWNYFLLGKKIANLSYKSGMTNGSGNFYNAEGTLVFEGNWVSNKLEGPTTTYFSNTGKVQNTGAYKNGLKSGIWKEYFSAGNLFMTGTYMNGTRNGVWQEFYPSGVLKSEGSYLAGRKSGSFLEYRPNGTLEISVTYNGATIRGAVALYSVDGKFKTRSFSIQMPVFSVDEIFENRGKQLVKKDNLKGEDIFYYPNGNPSLQQNWSMGDLSGSYTEFFENGKTKVSGQYKMGAASGEWVTYDSTGNIVSKEKKGGF